MQALGQRRFAVLALLIGPAALLTLCGCNRSVLRNPFPQMNVSVAESSRRTAFDSADETRARLAAVAELAPANVSDVADNLRRGQRELEAGRPDQAAQFFERVLRDEPDHAIAHHRLAVLADEAEDFASAEQHYKAALRTNSNDPDLLNDLGYSYLLQRRFGDAEQAFRTALSLSERHEKAIANLALLYSTVGSPDRARNVLRLASASGRDFERRVAQLPEIAAAHNGRHEHRRMVAMHPEDETAVAIGSPLRLAHAEQNSTRTVLAPPATSSGSDVSRSDVSRSDVVERYVRQSPATSGFLPVPSPVMKADAATRIASPGESVPLPLWSAASRDHGIAINSVQSAL
jgi:Tfp pilus assembly protein PilF